jgi:ferritin
MNKSYPQAQNPLLLRFHRLMDAFAKSDDERDFYLDKVEGFIVFVDLDKGVKELEDLERELTDNHERYCLIPKMTFYETKKFMEGFVNEKVYDIDTKEKLLDVIQSKEARENFLEFIYDHLTELEKWQQYYQERSRIRIIEWLRNQSIQFVFEEDLDLTKVVMEKIKRHIFDVKVPKDVVVARDALLAKAKTYYSNEALNPRPKRGRPPKQVVKVEIEPQVTVDMYTTVPQPVMQFLYLPDITSASSVTFSARFDTEAQLLASLRGSSRVKVDAKLQALSERLESLRHLSSRLADIQEIAISGRDDKLIRQVSKDVEEYEEEEDEEHPKKKKILDVVKDFLPKKREKEPKSASPDEPQPPKKPTVKTVTQIQKKHKK